MAGEVVVASAARTTTGASAALPMSSGDELVVEIEVTARSGTTPTLDLTVEWSQDGGTDFGASEAAADAFTQVATGTSLPHRKVRKFSKKGDHYRIVWTIAGTTPSFTFEVRADYE